MLLKLPHEIIVEIARKLEFKDKLMLAVTCQALHHLIASQCLYEKVVMAGTQEESKCILNKFKDNKIDGHQVKELWYHMTLLSDDVYVQFPDVFPNTTRYIDISPQHIKQARAGSPTSQLEKWRNTLEYYNSMDDWFKVATVLQNQTFSCLYFLHLSCSPGGSKQDIRRSIQFQDCIKNAPMLKELHLDSCIVTIEFLETVHTSCIQLHTFTIKESLYQIENGTLPQNIVPIKQLHNLNISGLASFSDQNCVLLDYIVAKYTGLKHLVFYPIPVEDTEILTVCYPDEFKDQLLLEPVEIGYMINSIMSTLVKKIALTHRIYRSEAARLLSRLPDTIKKLEFNGDMFDCVPESLEQTALKLVDLIIQQRLHNPPVFIEAGQLGCLRKCTFLKSFEVHLSPSLQVYNEGFASLSIVHLKAFIVKKYDYSDINLGWILAAFPLLEQLELYATKNSLFIKEEKTQPIYLKLKKLSLSISTIHPKFFNHLGMLTPNIDELSLHISDEDTLNIPKQQKASPSMTTRLVTSSTKDHVWDLRAFDLSVFQLFFIRNKKQYQEFHQRTSVHFNIQYEQETKSLIYHQGIGIAPIESCTKKTIASLPKVTLLCHKVGKAVLNERVEIFQNEGGITVVEMPFFYGDIPLVCCSLEI